MVTLYFDINNLMFRNLFSPDVITYKDRKKTEVESIDYRTLEFQIFNSIYLALFKPENKVSEVILAIDDKASWRKILWPKYKAKRKEKRDSLIGMDWNDFFSNLEEIMMNIKLHMPFKVFKVNNAEGDDVIGHLVHRLKRPSYLISTDKDYLQLCGKNMTIFNPHKKTIVSHPNPELFLTEECLKGQQKDNIYNIKTPLDHPDDARKPGFGAVAVEKVFTYGFDKWLSENPQYKERYEFNRQLMDFRLIPDEIKRRIDRDYDTYKMPDPNRIYEYLSKRNWPDYMGNFTFVEQKLLGLY